MRYAIETENANNEIRAFTKKLYGFELEGYHSLYFERRLNRFKQRHRITKTQDLIDLLLNNPTIASTFKNEFHISYTRLFREPAFFPKILRIIEEKIEKEGMIHIWHAGCAQGHEAFSLAILLEERHLLDKCKIYATDVNKAALSSATKGIIGIMDVKRGIRDYILAGGKEHIVNYFHFSANNAVITERLLSKIKFAEHELGKNPPFQKFDLVICRNVLIYYKDCYQKELLKTILASMHPHGYLGLSNCESLEKFEETNNMKKVDIQHNIYQVNSQISC